MTAAVDKDQAEAALERILGSEDFASSPRLAELLSFIVEETLAGRSRRLKAFNIANCVFGRDESFDANTDPLVRVQASRLRKAIERYYLTTGAFDPVRISIPKGGYVAVLTTNDGAQPAAMVAAREPTDGPTIAILPFETIADEEDRNYLASGITEELSTALTQFEVVHVISWRSAQNYSAEGKDVRQIGRDLGARFVLNGTVQRSADTLRVSASLADCESGESIWATTYTSELKTTDIFEIRDDIAGQVAARVADAYGVIPRLLEKEAKSKRLRDLNSYGAVLKFYHYNTHLNVENYLWARRALERAIEKDPDYAVALAALAELLWDNQILRYVEPYVGIDKAYSYARRAVAADSECQAAWYAMAFVNFLRGERELCLDAANRIIELNSNRPYYVGTAGFVIALAGDWDRGLELMRKSILLNPYYPTWLNLAPFEFHFFKGEYEEALAYAERMRAPGVAWDPLARMVAMAKSGRRERATILHSQLKHEHPDFDEYAREYIGYLVFKEDDADLLYDVYVDVCNAVAR